MFGKLFKSKQVPTNEGKKGAVLASRLKVIRAFELELSNMEGSPAYSLTHQLTIGSEIGNIIIADSSVSPRHATFQLQQDVVSVVDHGSVNGTTVNGKQIPSGRSVILEESDTIGVGDLEIRIRSSNQELAVDESEEIQEIEEEVPPIPKKTAVKGKAVVSKFDKLLSVFKKKPATPSARGGKPKMALVLNSTSIYSANALVRVVAVGLDLLLAYTVLVVFWPFDEFRHFIEFIPSELASLLGVEWGSLWESFIQDYSFAQEISSGAYEYVSGFVKLGPLFLIFILLRFVFTLILGVSLSEFLIGIKFDGNKFWARIGGPLRVLVGAFTGFFIIFDVPAIVSRRTFKEFTTFTNIQVRSKFITILASLFVIPLYAGMALLSPLLQGFEPPETILVNDRIEKRVKVKAAVATEATPEPAEVMVQPASAISKFFNLDLTYNPSELCLIPVVKFQGVKNRVSYSSQMIFYQRELQRPVTIELFKEFNFQQLLSIGIKGNFFLYSKFPELHSYVNQAEGNPAFRPAMSELAQTKFANELMSFTKLAFELSLENAFEVMEMETPFLKGLMDFRSSLLSLIEYKDFEQIGFIKLGNAIFMRVSYNKQKPFDLIIPLIKGEGRIFKVEFDKKENLSALSSKFYKYSLDESNWLKLPTSVPTETLNAFQVMDFLSTPDLKKKSILGDRAQALYGYYFEKSSEIFRKQDSVEYELWKKSLEGVVKVVESLQEEKVTEEGSLDPVSKLKQNFKDLKEAVDTKNLTYFGLTDSLTI